jgi:predicted negative regulator of RcsB-dependent stress response
MKKPSISLIFLVLPFFLVVPHAWSQQPVTLEEGIRQYQIENYEEAVDILTQVRANNRSSSAAAFFLGMAHKQVMDYPKAAENLQDAVTLSPPIQEALIELVDALYQMDRLDEARKWLAVAEKEGVSPARAAFLKGLILSKENDNPAAISAFENAKRIDPTLSQAAEFHIGVSYMKDRKLDKAKERFQAVVQHDALSDLAAFARQYQSVLEQAIDQDRPLRLTVGIMGGYDTNMVSKPIDAAVAGDITDEEAAVLSSSVRLDYVPRLDGPWLFNAQAAVASTVNSNHTHSHDSFASSFSMAPGYNFGTFAVNFTASYTNALLRTDPDPVPAPDSSPGYKRYLDYWTFGPTLRVMMNQNNILEVFGGYDKKAYYNQKTSNPESIRDSVGLREYISWIWLFKENAFFNLRYDFNQDHADGIYWESVTNRVTANLSIPLFSEETAKRAGQLNLQMTGGAAWQDYRYEQPDPDGQGNLEMTKRRDRLYTGSLGLSWVFSKNASFIVQATRTKNDSNIAVNSYERDLYMSGFEFRY